MTLMISMSLTLQSQDDLEPSDDLSANHLNTLQVVGTLDYVMPYELRYTQGEEECLGQIILNNLTPIMLEGDCADTTISLYEYDQHARVTSIISGTIKEGIYDLSWYNHDYTQSYHLHGDLDKKMTNEITTYKAKTKDHPLQLMLWTDHQYIQLSSSSHPLKWDQYTCLSPPYACSYDNYQGHTQDMTISDRSVTIDDRIYEYEHRVKVNHKSGHDYSYFYNFRYPYIGADNFDSHIASLIRHKLDMFAKGLPTLKAGEEWQLDNRLEHKAIGDFHLSLVTEDIVSGFLTFYSSLEPHSITIPFTYERSKNRFYKISEIWRKDFNFSYFLKTLLENQKRELIIKEDPVARKLLKDAPFSFYNFTEEGILFFTEHNVISGRQHILIPYDEVSGFIGDKTLSKFIKERL